MLTACTKTGKIKWGAGGGGGGARTREGVCWLQGRCGLRRLGTWQQRSKLRQRHQGGGPWVACNQWQQCGNVWHLLKLCCAARGHNKEGARLRRMQTPVQSLDSHPLPPFCSYAFPLAQA